MKVNLGIKILFFLFSYYGLIHSKDKIENELERELLSYFSNSCSKLLNKADLESIILRNFIKTFTSYFNVQKFIDDFNKYKLNNLNFSYTVPKIFESVIDSELFDQKKCNYRVLSNNELDEFTLLKLEYGNFKHNDGSEFEYLLHICKLKHTASEYMNNQLNNTERIIFAEIADTCTYFEYLLNIELQTKTKAEIIDILMRRLKIEYNENAFKYDVDNYKLYFMCFINKSFIKYQDTKLKNIIPYLEQALYYDIFENSSTMVINNQESLNTFYLHIHRKIIESAKDKVEFLPFKLIQKILYLSCIPKQFTAIEFEKKYILDTVSQMAITFNDNIPVKLRVMRDSMLVIKEIKESDEVSPIPPELDKKLVGYAYLHEPIINDPSLLDIDEKFDKTLRTLTEESVEAKEFIKRSKLNEIRMKCKLSSYEGSLNKNTLSNDIEKLTLLDCKYFEGYFKTETLESVPNETINGEKEPYLDGLRNIISKTRDIYNEIPYSNVINEELVPSTSENEFITDVGILNHILGAVDEKCIINKDVNNYYSRLFEWLKAYKTNTLRYWKLMCSMYKDIFFYMNFYNSLKLLSSDDIKLTMITYLKIKEMNESILQTPKIDNIMNFGRFNDPLQMKYRNEILDCFNQIHDNNIENLISDYGVIFLGKYSRLFDICKDNLRYQDLDTVTDELHIILPSIYVTNFRITYL